MHRQFSSGMVLTLAALVMGVWGGSVLAGGGGALHFVDSSGSVSSLPGITDGEKEVEVADYDNDGDLDVVIGNGQSDFGARNNKLYRNDLIPSGTLDLVEVSGTSTVTDFGNTDVTRNAFFRDYNNDNLLDIIIINDDNTAGDAGRTKVFIQNSSNQFIEEGVSRLGAGTGGAACSGVSEDFDGDNDMDLYVGNYPGPSQDTMYFNNGSGFFTEVTGTHLPSDGDYTVDIAAGDMNGDGQIDILVSNWSDNLIYYNNKNGAGSEEGDYSYTGSVQNLGEASSNENAMEPADFDGDGDLDFYWSNAPGGDRIYVNTGNDGANRAQFTPFAGLPASVTGETTRKATVADFNNDGRLDIFVMKESGRPTLLRNCSFNGNLEFADWTPASFPNGSSLSGWHAGAIDADNDGDIDLLLGGFNGEFLYLNDSPTPLDENVQGSTMPAIYNAAPVLLNGTIGASSYSIEAIAHGTAPPLAASAASSGPSAAAGNPDDFDYPDLPIGANVTFILSSADDYTLEVRNPDGTLVGTSDRGGAGVEEVVSFVASQSGDYQVSVILNGVPGIPTVSEWGIIVMTLLVLTAGTVVFSRRKPVMA